MGNFFSLTHCTFGLSYGAPGNLMFRSTMPLMLGIRQPLPMS
jgi:hypothetical protein